MDTENELQAGTTHSVDSKRKPWKSPALIFSEFVKSTEKLSSPTEFYVPQFRRTLGPS